MPNYTQGSTRAPLQQPDVASAQSNGSVVLDSRRTRPMWFDGRFLDARDFDREQNYFLQREADLAQAPGFGVMTGFMVDRAPNNNQAIVISAGAGVTPAGEMLTVSNDLTISLANLDADPTLDAQFGIANTPAQSSQNRTGLFVIALRAVEYTATPIAAFPTTVQGARSTHDGDIIEATEVALVPYPSPAASFTPSLQQAALARQIFLTGNPAALPDSLLPLALVSLTQGSIAWLDPYLVRRDTGPQFSGVRFGLTDPATQQAYLMQYDTQLQAAVAARQSAGLKANFAASDFFQALPPAGRFPIDAIDATAFSQVFFPQQMDVRLSIIPSEELAALLEDSMSLPPIDLTLPSSAYSNLSVFAFIPVPLENFAALRNSLPQIPLNPTLPQVLANRSPLQLLQLFQGQLLFTSPTAVSNNAWTAAVGNLKYGYYLRRRSSPAFVAFTTPLNLVLSSTPDPSIQGQTVTFTVNVIPTTATGSVQFLDGPNLLGSATLSSGAATITSNALTGGTHSITVVYAGDATHAPNTSNVFTQIVNRAPSTTTLTVSPSANPSLVGAALTLSAKITPAGATGSVQFFDGDSLLGVATVTSSGSAAAALTFGPGLGAHSLTASYSGDTNFASSVSAPITQNVVKATSSVTVTTSAASIVPGQTVTFTATVTPQLATGSVQFLDGAGVLGSATLTGGSAIFSTTSLALGSHSITASYAGDSNTSAAQSQPLTQSVVNNTSNILVNTSPNPSTFGQAVTISASVTPPTATGSIKFLDGTTVLGTVNLSGGTATLPATTALAIGSHSITASYSGDASDAASVSNPTVQTVSKLATSVAINVSPNPVNAGAPVTVSANVTPASATGAVQFFDGVNSLGSANLTSGVAQLPANSSLIAGAHTITASYAGDNSNLPSVSQAFALTVNKVTTTTTLAITPNPSNVGQAVTFNVQVTPATATGSIQIMDGASLIATATLSGGKATGSLSTLAVGGHAITAVYSGDANNNPSTSTAVAQTVSKTAPSVALSASLTAPSFGQSVTFTAKVAPSSATGSIVFMDGTASLGSVTVNGGVATFTTSALAVAAHSITAVYSGDGNNAPATSNAVGVTVSKAASSVALISTATIVITGATVTFTATVSPANATGSVTFIDTGKSLAAVAVSGGVAKFSSAALPIGANSVTAAYSGDANFAASTSNPAPVTVQNTTTRIPITTRPIFTTVHKILDPIRLDTP